MNRRIASGLLAFILAATYIVSSPKPISASCGTIPFTFTNSVSIVDASTTNANNAFLVGCATSVDNTQIGPAGIFPSQVIAASFATGTFGGAFPYRFAITSTTNVPLTIQVPNAQVVNAFQVGNVAQPDAFTIDPAMNVRTSAVLFGVYPAVPPPGSNNIAADSTGSTQGQVFSVPGSTSTGWTFKQNTTQVYNISAAGVPHSAVALYAITTFSSSGTFTTPANSSTTTVYHYRIIAAGGGGGGANGVAAGGGGGGAGGYAEGLFSGIAPSTGITITVGVGGTAGGSTGTIGGNGGNSIIGSPISLTTTGGGGGAGSTSAAAGNISPGGGGGSVSGGTPAPSLIVIGASGLQGQAAIASSVLMAGAGAASIFGGGGLPSNPASSGGTGPVPGSGGGGGSFTTSTGGAGAGGAVIIERITP